MEKMIGFALAVAVVLTLVHVVKDYIRDRNMSEVERLKQEWRGW